MDIAALENTKAFIRPVGQITSFHYFSPRQQQQKQEQKKETTFQMLFQMELQGTPAKPEQMEENQNFQMYVWERSFMTELNEEERRRRVDTGMYDAAFSVV